MAKGKRSSGGRNLEQQQSFYQSQIDNAESLKLTNVELKEYEAGLKRVNALIQKNNLFQEASLTSMTEMSDSIKSLGAGLGKNNKLFETMNLFGAQFQGTLTSVSKMLKHETLKGATGFTKQTYKTVEAYKNLGNTIAINGKKLLKQQITQSQYNQAVLDGYEDIEEEIDRLTGQLEGMGAAQKKSAEEVITTLKEEKDVLEATAKAAEKSKKNLEGTAFALDTISSTGIPGMNELSSVIMKAKEGGMGLTLAFAALGAALGKMAYDTGLFGDKLKTVAGYDKKLAGIASKIEVINQKIALGMAGGPNFVAQEAAMNFGTTMTQMAIEFQQASRTALFGDKLGGVGYGAAQLQIAGIAAENIATAMKDATSVMGSNVSGQFGADMAILAARTGQTSEGIASISDTFMRLDGVSKEVSLNMQEGLRTMAKQANVNLGALMEDVAAASKDALSYQIKSGPALAKAATFAQSLGTKFTDIANAGKSMVLNYKDSIKAEMSLSAMLGKRVDLSQVRALFASGDQEGALKALKAQGLDPSKMNMFQQEALKNATGGLDLNSLQKIATKTGRTGGELGQEKVSVGNNKFLMTKESAESAKAIGSAVASAMAQLAIQEKITGPLEQAKQQAIVDNTLGLKDLMYEQSKVELAKEIQVGIEAAIPMLVGALAAVLIGNTLVSGLTGLIKGKGGANPLKNMFKSKGVAPNSLVSPNASISSGMKFNSSGRVINAQTGRFAPTGTANAFKSSQSLVQPAGTFAKPGMASSLESSVASNVIQSGSKMSSAAKIATKFAKVGGPVLSVLGAAMDFSERKDKGQTTIQAGMGAGMGAAGGMAGAAYGAALGSVVPVFGTIVGGLIGGAVGYFGGSSIADALTGANEEVVTAQDATLVQSENMTEEQIAQGIDNGTLLSDSAYALELQQKMLEVMGLQAEILYDIASEQRAVTSVNLDGAKVLSLLNSRSNKSYGVARNTMPATVLAKRTSSE